MEDTYFEQTGLPVFVVTPPSTTIDYTSTASQAQLLALGDAVVANAYTEDASLSSWCVPTPSSLTQPPSEWLSTCAAGPTEV